MDGKKKTPSELLSIIQEQLSALTSTVQQLQQAVAVQQKPQNEQPLSSNENGLELSGRRINRKRRSVHEPEREPESVPKPKQTRRHSMHSKAISKRQDSVVEKPKRSTAPENARAKKNRLSNLRNSVARDRAIDVEVADDVPIPPNKNCEIYATNSLYRTLCLYCNKTEKFLVRHYMNQHPEYEVPVARLSPVMAERLRAQAERFQINMGKIQAFCLFCEENKTMPKNHWASHLMLHTGSENIFACDTCNMQFKNKTAHKNCAGEAINVFWKNSSDTSLVAYMCKDCNYIQIHLSAIHKHLINEHKYETISETMFEKLTLIPDMSQLHSPVSEKYRFAEALQRFKCTICQTQLEDAQQFTAHFSEQHNVVDQYECFCGEIVRKNDGQIPGAEWVAAHLLMHRTDLYQCMICSGVVLRKNDILAHMFKKHRNSEMKFQHVSRNPNRHTKITETTIVKMKCNVCNRLMDCTLTTALDHFNNEHPAEKFSATGIAVKKVSILARTSADLETTYEGGIQFNIQVS